MVTRAVNELFPEWVATVVDKDGWTVKEWGVTFDDVVRVKETIARSEALEAEEDASFRLQVNTTGKPST